MAYELHDFQSYQDYFNEIADSHNEIAGFIFGDLDIVNNESRAWKDKKLWLEPYPPVTIIDSLSDNFLHNKQGSLWVGGAPPSGKFSDIYAWFKSCENIIKDIIAKILQDRYQEKLITRLSSFKYGMGEYTVGATRMVGCRLDFTFTDPTGLEYNEDKWT